MPPSPFTAPRAIPTPWSRHAPAAARRVTAWRTTGRPPADLRHWSPDLTVAAMMVVLQRPARPVFDLRTLGALMALPHIQSSPSRLSGLMAWCLSHTTQGQAASLACVLLDRVSLKLTPQLVVRCLSSNQQTPMSYPHNDVYWPHPLTATDVPYMSAAALVGRLCARLPPQDLGSVLVACAAQRTPDWIPVSLWLTGWRHASDVRRAQIAHELVVRCAVWDDDSFQPTLDTSRAAILALTHTYPTWLLREVKRKRSSMGLPWHVGVEASMHALADVCTPAAAVRLAGRLKRVLCADHPPDLPGGADPLGARAASGLCPHLCPISAPDVTKNGMIEP